MADVDLYESAWLGVISQRISEPGIPKYQLKLACKHWFNTGWVVFYSYSFLFLSLQDYPPYWAWLQSFPPLGLRWWLPAAFHRGVPMLSQPWRFCSHTMHRQVSPLRVWVVSPLMIVLAVVTCSEDDALGYTPAVRGVCHCVHHCVHGSVYANVVSGTSMHCASGIQESAFQEGQWHRPHLNIQEGHQQVHAKIESGEIQLRVWCKANCLPPPHAWQLSSQVAMALLLATAFGNFTQGSEIQNATECV